MRGALIMKFNEEQIKGLIQNEKSNWDGDDLSWFDEDCFSKFEEKKLSADEHQKIIFMLANDQAVMDHFLEMKRKFEKPAKPMTGFFKMFEMKKPIILMVSLASFAVSSWLIFSTVEPIKSTDLLRSPTEFLIYPKDKMTLQNAPTYLVAPQMETDFKIELHRANHMIWGSPELNTPRIYLPPEIRSQLTVGLYNWKILTADDHLVHSYYFNIE